MDLINQIAKSPAILKEIYGDLAKPGVQQAGKALSTIIGLGNTMLWPVVLLNEKAKISLQNNLEKYREKLEKVPEEDICEVPPEVGVPIAEKFSYVSNEELSEMYAELLAKASLKSQANLAHPSFVNVINNISPDEAILLKSILETGDLSGLPFVEVRWSSKLENQWTTVDPMFMGLSCLNELQHPHNIEAYISNLEGLGLFHVRRDIYIAGDNIYEPLEDSARKNFATLEETAGYRCIECIRGKIEITSFARLFLYACFTGVRINN